MKKFLTIFTISALFGFSAYAVEVELPNSAGRIDITNGVVTVPNGTKIADGVYKVIVDNVEVTVEFISGRGSIK